MKCYQLLVVTKHLSTRKYSNSGACEPFLLCKWFQAFWFGQQEWNSRKPKVELVFDCEVRGSRFSNSAHGGRTAGWSWFAWLAAAILARKSCVCVHYGTGTELPYPLSRTNELVRIPRLRSNFRNQTTRCQEGSRTAVSRDIKVDSRVFGSNQEETRKYWLFRRPKLRWRLEEICKSSTEATTGENPYFDRSCYTKNSILWTTAKRKFFGLLNTIFLHK